MGGHKIGGRILGRNPFESIQRRNRAEFMKTLILSILILLMSCKKDTDFNLTIKSNQKSEFTLTTYYDIGDLKANGSFKFKNSESILPQWETQPRYIGSEYAYKVECKGSDSAEYYIYKNRNMVKMYRGNFTMIIDKGKIK